MRVAEKADGASPSPAPLPAKLANLLREAKWLALVAVAVYLLLILVTFHKADPGWSHEATAALTQNAGGRLGAWLADLLLYLFGVSSYWLVLLCLYIVVWGYRRLDGSALIEARPLVIALAGFAVLLLASASLEAVRLHTLRAELPLAPGGLAGDAFGSFASGNLGFTGATLLLITLAAMGFSLFTGISLIAAAEFTGLMLEGLYGLAKRLRESRQDRRIGEIAREEREHVVEIEKKREENHEPLYIEPPVVEIKKSLRVEKEKQAPLFDNLPDTPLPPLKLLDEASKARLRVLAGRRVTDADELLIIARNHRTQEGNRREALARLQALVEAARIAPVPRRATRPTRASKQRRLQTKAHDQRVKQMRGKVRDRD